MIRNVEHALQLLKERELELLADRNALPQLEIIHQLMRELEQKLSERLHQFQTLEDSLVLSHLMQQGTAVLAEGTHLSIGMINKYLKFTTMQQTLLSSTIHPEKVREFIVSMYDPPLDSDTPNVYQLLSFMEQNQYADEAMDGLWVPVKFASPLSGTAVSESVQYLETYEPLTEPIDLSDPAELLFVEEVVSLEQLSELMGDTEWLLTKSMIQTEAIEQYMAAVEEAPVEQVIIEATSSEWGDAINALTAITALIGNKTLDMEQINAVASGPPYAKLWDWIEPDDRNQRITSRKLRKENQHDE